MRQLLSATVPYLFKWFHKHGVIHKEHGWQATIVQPLEADSDQISVKFHDGAFEVSRLSQAKGWADSGRTYNMAFDESTLKRFVRPSSQI